MTRRARWIVFALFLLIFLVVLPIMAMYGLFRGGIEFTRGKGTVLVVSVKGNMHEYHPSFSPADIFGRGEQSLTDILTCLRRAGDDRDVEAVILRIFPSGAGSAKCEEVRMAVSRLKERGKEVLAYSPLLVNNHYLLAAEADSVFMPPSGYLIINGPAASAAFLGGTMEKLDIKPNIHSIGDYKTAAEAFTRTERSPESEEMAGWLLRDIFDRFIDTISEKRNMDRAIVTGLVNRAVYSPSSASGSGLIDGIRYWDQVTGRFRDAGMNITGWRDYLNRSGPGYPGGGERIGVVHVQGTIVMGKSGFDPSAGVTAGSKSLVRELRRVRRDDRIKAVILRVDSPGGDGMAGEMVSRQVELTARTKPVVVSMSDVAASGGYQISYRADRIVALPGTVTGSIGSITGKMNMRGFYRKIGFSRDEMSAGEKGLMFSDYRDFSRQEWDVLKEEHWDFYGNWIEDIARCRGMREGEVDSLGRGRVWTGEQARERGLVDHVGDLATAVEVASRLSGIASPEKVKLLHYPERAGILKAIFSGGLVENSLAYAAYSILHPQNSSDRYFIRCLAPGYPPPLR